MNSESPPEERNYPPEPPRVELKKIRLLWGLPALVIVALYCANLQYAGFRLQSFLLVLSGQIGYLCIIVASSFQPLNFKSTAIKKWAYTGIFFLLANLLLHFVSWVLGIH